MSEQMSEAAVLTDADTEWFREECAVCLGNGCRKCEAVRDEVDRIVRERVAQALRSPPAPFWCYPCSRGEHSACSGIAWQPDISCECKHSEAATPPAPTTDPRADAALAWLETVAGDAAVREAALSYWEKASHDERWAAREGYDAAVAALLAAVRSS